MITTFCPLHTIMGISRNGRSREWHRGQCGIVGFQCGMFYVLPSGSWNLDVDPKLWKNF